MNRLAGKAALVSGIGLATARRFVDEGAHAVHIMSFVGYAGDEGTTSEAIAKSLQTQPGRGADKLLEREGLVALRQGRQGGVGLRRPASRITLIYEAVKSDSGVFAMRSLVHDGCVVACAMKRRLGPIFNAASDAVEQASQQNESGGAGTRRPLNLPESVTNTDMFDPRE